MQSSLSIEDKVTEEQRRKSVKLQRNFLILPLSKFGRVPFAGCGTRNEHFRICFTRMGTSMAVRMETWYGKIAGKFLTVHSGPVRGLLVFKVAISRINSGRMRNYPWNRKFRWRGGRLREANEQKGRAPFGNSPLANRSEYVALFSSSSDDTATCCLHQMPIGLLDSYRANSRRNFLCTDVYDPRRGSRSIGQLIEVILEKASDD